MLDILLGRPTNRKSNTRFRNEAEMMKEDTKKKADSFYEAYNMVESETDIDKQIKMRIRLYSGITDFSDL